MHILIAEDDLDMQKILRMYLQKDGSKSVLYQTEKKLLTF